MAPLVGLQSKIFPGHTHFYRYCGFLKFSFRESIFAHLT